MMSSMNERSADPLWHPFADMSAVAGHELVIARGEGCWVWDDAGRRYLDGSSSLWYCNVGHGRPEIRAAIDAQLGELEAFHVFGDFANRPALALAERLASLAPQAGSKVFLTSGGGDSIDTAVKLARLHHHAAGHPERRVVLHRTHGYHGTHGIGTSILGMPYRDEFGPLVEDTAELPHDSLDALADAIARIGADRIAAFVFEPVIGSGGVHPPAPGYLEGVQALCREHGIITIADIVITGFGRIGEWLAVERFGIEPDLIAFAKGVTSGYLPLGGVIVAPGIAEPFWSGEAGFMHGQTYSGHPVCCAAALANLDLLAADGLVHRARECEGWFRAAFDAIAEHPLIGEVRGGIGFMAAVELAPDVLEARPDAAGELWRAAREAGLMSRGLWTGIALAPPLTIDEDELAYAVDAVATALDAIS